MRVCLGINQLCAHAYTVPCSLHAPFEYVRDTELACDLAKVACCRILVLHHARATDNLEVGDLSEVGKNFVLDTVGEEGIGLFLALVFERQHADGFFGNRWRIWHRFCLPLYNSEVNARKHKKGERHDATDKQ